MVQSPTALFQTRAEPLTTKATSPNWLVPSAMGRECEAIMHGVSSITSSGGLPSVSDSAWSGLTSETNVASSRIPAASMVAWRCRIAWMCSSSTRQENT
jgi:hypothetical protein